MRDAGADQRRSDLALIALCAGVLALAALLPSPQGQTLRLFGRPTPEICWLKSRYGVPCPGCGLTRSFITLAHGEPRRSWGFHPLGPAAFALTLAVLANRLCSRLWGRRVSDTWELGALVALSIAALLRWPFILA